jgi:hypothetical protein
MRLKLKGSCGPRKSEASSKPLSRTRDMKVESRKRTLKLKETVKRSLRASDRR